MHIFIQELIQLLVILVKVQAFTTTNRQGAASSNSRLHVCSNTEQILRDNGFGRRLRTLVPSDLPLTAELQDHGAWEICRIIKLDPPNKAGLPPKLQVELHDGSVRTTDLGQVTTIWESGADVEWNLTLSQIDSFPLQTTEYSMQKMYEDYVVRSRSSDGGPTKKQLARILEKVPHRQHTEQVLRKVLKAGDRMVRLVDSLIAMEYLYGDYPKTDQEAFLRRAVSGNLLSQDTSLGGKFKRMSCIFVDTKQNEDGVVQSMSLVNGGWLVVDDCTRAGTEARKFAQRTQVSRILTIADERIAHRLECLAMGDVLGANTDENDLEIDVRESLKALNLPVTPDGAQQALVLVGRWSDDAQVGKLQPWSQETLLAAKEYAKADIQRRQALFHECMNGDGNIEGRVDLSKLPSICIDAKSTTFRDDAIGVRPRASTGRPVIAEASKWELLIHIADVSDIYSPQVSTIVDSNTIDTLREAAIGRGVSRYDLPLGPLHLMPPTALRALGFVTCTEGVQVDLPSRCVTLWAYIDERTGDIVDVGLERTLISSPLALSYDVASDYLENRANLKHNQEVARVAAILSLAERNLNQWAKQHKQTNEAARRREERLTAKEVISMGNRQGFQRTRGHRLVDTALDLYGVSLTRLLRRNKAPIPRASGSGTDRSGRVATAPLRRLVDGMAQRQALAVLCAYGGKPLTTDECREINAQANEAMDRLANLRPLKKRGKSVEQQIALARLEQQRQIVLTAVGTGRGNEVSIQGAVGKCNGVKGSLKSGQIVKVRVQNLNIEKGILIVEKVT